MENKENILKRAIKVKEVLIPGIYFLINKNEIVYVGSSELNVYGRISRHISDKVFDKFYIELHKENIKEIEVDYIFKFAPKYNKVLPKNDKYKMVSTLDDDYENKLVNIECCILENKLYIKKDF